MIYNLYMLDNQSSKCPNLFYMSLSCAWGFLYQWVHILHCSYYQSAETLNEKREFSPRKDFWIRHISLYVLSLRMLLTGVVKLKLSLKLQNLIWQNCKTKRRKVLYLSIRYIIMDNPSCYLTGTQYSLVLQRKIRPFIDVISVLYLNCISSIAMVTY